MMKKVLFDLVATQPLDGSIYHGGGEYSKAVFKAAVEKGYKFDALYDSRKPLDSNIEALCTSSSISLIDLGGRTFSEAYSGYDAFFTGLPYGKFTDGENSSGTKLIYTIHGTRSLEIPSDRYELPFYLSGRAWKRILKAVFIRIFPRKYRQIAADKVRRLLNMPNSQVVTVSNHTMYSLLSFFPELSRDNLMVCYSPLFFSESDKTKSDIDNFLEKLNLSSGEFYLALGSGRWLKNNYRLALAFDRLVSEGRITGRKLVMTGGRHSIYKKLRNKDSFVFLDYLESSYLEVLFKKARALLYPSLNEGFGYPPLQAMRYGTPVLASAFSAVPEVCENAALYTNPYSVDEIASRILMLEDDAIHRRFAAAGPLRFEEVERKQRAMLDTLLEFIFGKD